MQQKKDSFGTTFFYKKYQNILPRILLKLVSNESFALNGTFSVTLIGV